MKAIDLFQNADLEGAIAAARDEVRSRPQDADLRLFFIDLLLFQGEFERAGRQLDTLVTLDPELGVCVLTYKNLMEAHEAREAFFLRGMGEPELFRGDAPEEPWMREQVEAIKALARGEAETAKDACERVRASLPPVRGSWNGEPFQSLCDCDDLLGPFLEIIAQDKLVFVPWSAVASLTCEPPRLALHQLFAPATLELRAGPAFDVHLPVLYPGAAHDPDVNVRLGRLTDWTYPTQGLIRGKGRKQFDTGGAEHSCLELRKLEIQPAATETNA